jgi:predicted CoA-binding protein
MADAASGGRRTVVIVGASDKPDRTSHQLLRRLDARPEYLPVPVHPRLREIAGHPVLDSLSQAPAAPDVVTLYVNAQASASLEEELKRLRPRKVVFNPGAENPALMAALESAGIPTEEACSLVLLSQNAL